MDECTKVFVDFPVIKNVDVGFSIFQFYGLCSLELNLF